MTILFAYDKIAPALAKTERFLNLVNMDEETDARTAVDPKFKINGLLCIRNYKNEKCIQVMYWLGFCRVSVNTLFNSNYLMHRTATQNFL